MSNQNLEDVTASGVIMRIHRWLAKGRGKREKKKKSLSKAANVNFQPENLSLISSLPASYMYRNHTDSYK